MGLADVPRAERTLAGLGVAEGPLPGSTKQDEGLLAALAVAAAPDLSLSSLARIAQRASAALADPLTRHPGDRAVLAGASADERPEPKAIRAELLRAVGADPDDQEPRASRGAGDHAGALGAAYHRRLLHLAARDLTGAAVVDEVADELADIAGGILEAALAVARADLLDGAVLPAGTPLPRFAVIA